LGHGGDSNALRMFTNNIRRVSARGARRSNRRPGAR
jgi:hypothetical protein